MKYLFFFITLLYSYSTFSQWTSNTSNNAFDGQIKSISLLGTGGKYPYGKPLFVINYFKKQDKINFYVTNVRGAICSNKVMYFNFDNSSEIYEVNSIGKDTNSESWFVNIDKEYFKSGNSFRNNIDFLEKIISSKYMKIRLVSNCSKADYSFELGNDLALVSFFIEKAKRIEEKAKRIGEIRKEFKKNRNDVEEKRKMMLLNKKRKLDSIEKRKLDSIYNLGKDFIDNAEKSYKINKEKISKKQILELEKKYGFLISKYPLSKYDYLFTKFEYTYFHENKELTKIGKITTGANTLIICYKNKNSEINKKDYYRVKFIVGIGERDLFVSKSYLTKTMK